MFFKSITKNIFFSVLGLSFSIFAFVGLATSIVYASETNGTIISIGDTGYAWSNQAGWMNFGTTNGGISITDAGIIGYAWNSNYGWINMNPSNGGVLVAVNGALSGYAWGSSLGWIDFSGVSINSSGKFTGQANGTIIGILTFDCINCDVRTDFRPTNFRTIIPTTVSRSSGGGGGGIIGGITTPLPPNITASNVPLTIAPSQSGTLTQNLSVGKKVELKVKSGTAPSTLTFTVEEQTVSVSTTAGISVVGEGIFDIQAFNTETGERVYSFDKPIQITLTVPEELQGRSDIDVYFLNEELNVWEKISNITFSGGNASFFVDHLTLFGIFSALDLPSFIQPFFALPTASEVTPSEVVSGEVPSGTKVELIEETLLPAQLFDIRLLVDNTNVSRVIDLSARVTFESFGRVPTPVSMTFTITDEDGRDIWSAVDTITVETEQVFVKRFFDAPELLSGNYTLHLTTLYNTDVQDEFKAPFTIEPKGAGWNWMPWFAGGLLILLAILVFVWWLIMRRRREQEKRGLYTPFS